MEKQDTQKDNALQENEIAEQKETAFVSHNT